MVYIVANVIIYQIYLDVFTSCNLSRNGAWGAGFVRDPAKDTVLTDAGAEGGFSSSVHAQNRKFEHCV